MTADPLRTLLSIYDEAVTELNGNIDVSTAANTALVTAKADVQKSKFKLDLVKEQIMCEKKLIDAGR